MDHLQKDLWQWPKSRAAVMVGAGLSLNAEPLPGVTKRFPTWNQLVRPMYDELHPPSYEQTPQQAKEREAGFSRASPLRIASEYEAAFGEGKLEGFIRDHTPDEMHRPGALHRILLQLPWADIFTTNYDTLLERTEVFGRNYNTVMKAKELTTAFAPRIVKLHGTLPSHGPLIITEEHYRTYPRRFAPFVNCVQQSLLENSFVLIGFSGDDPNFLEWTGWIRDELGDSHAPIYFVGALSLTAPQRSLLQRRGVTPIDLAPLFSDSNESDIHARAIEWFLRSLWGARNLRAEEWPDIDPKLPKVQPSLPPLAVFGYRAPEAVELGPRGPIQPGDARKVIRRWRSEREQYPGWIVAPAPVRADLWDKTKLWFQWLVDFAKTWPPADRILLFREVNWRLETTMAPFFADLLEPFQRALNELFDGVTAGDTLLPSSGFISPAEASDVPDAWCEVALSLLRDAREDYHSDRWDELKAKLDVVLQRHPKYADRVFYESALWAAWNMNRKQAQDVLARWQVSSRAPLAQMRKAALLAEMDKLGEAVAILRSTLGEIRGALRNQGQNIKLLSLEGWCTYVLWGVELGLNNRDSESWDEVRERWQELKAFDCNPWSHIEYFEETLAAAPPPVKDPEEAVHGFDPGEVTLSRKLGHDDISPLLPAFGCIRLYEQAALPMRLATVKMGGEMLKNACHWLAPFATFWSPALLMRAGKHDDLASGEWLTRLRVAIMEPTLVQRIYVWCSQILEREIVSFRETIEPGSSLESNLSVLPEVLSRLTLRSESSELRRAFGLAVRLYTKLGVGVHPKLDGVCDQWFKRLFMAADRELLLEWLPTLIRLPLFPDVKSGDHADQLWPDPMRQFPAWRCRQAATTDVDAIPTIHEATAWLLKRLASEDGEARRRGLERLVTIFTAKLMSQDQQNEFAGQLWSRTTSAGLPDRPRASVSFLLFLPSPPTIDARSLITNHILGMSSQGFVHQGASGAISIGFGPRELPAIREVALSSMQVVRVLGEYDGGIEWTTEQADQLYQKAHAWWENDKSAFRLEEDRRLFLNTDSVRSTAGQLWRFLARAVIPRVDWPANAKRWQELLAWLNELRETQIFPTAVLPYVLLRQPGESETVAATVRSDMDSEMNEKVSAAALAVRHWALLAAAGKTIEPPSEVLAALVERVVFRRGPGIKSCVSHLALLITQQPDSIQPTQARLLSASLDPWHYATILAAGSSGTPDFKEVERPDLRSRVANLAAALRIWYFKCAPDTTEPPSIQRWQDRCKSDPLPEVRRAFDEWYADEGA